MKNKCLRTRYLKGMCNLIVKIWRKRWSSFKFSLSHKEIDGLHCVLDESDFGKQFPKPTKPRINECDSRNV